MISLEPDERYRQRLLELPLNYLARHVVMIGGPYELDCIGNLLGCTRYGKEIPFRPAESKATER